MSHTFIRSDIDGDLLHYEQTKHYCKRLSTGVAWQIYDPLDLENIGSLPVEQVVTDHKEGFYYIHYVAALTPLDLAKLRQLLPLNRPFSRFRVVRLAMDLCNQLKMLHDEAVPQLLIHPERVGEWNDGFALIPTLACLLPPLSQIHSNKVGGWLEFIAPEVLRTRALNKDILFAGDIYSLGRLLQALLNLSWMPNESTDALLLAESRVEKLEDDLSSSSPNEDLQDLLELFRTMSGFLPEDRPSLESVLTTLLDLEKQESPPKKLSDLLSHREISELENCVADLRLVNDARIYGSWSRLIHITQADLALLKDPPDCSQALLELAAASTDDYEADIERRRGHAYALFKNMENHERFSSEAYEMAALLTNWSNEILDEWVSRLKEFSSSFDVIEATSIIPIEGRNIGIVLMRAQWWQKQGAYLDAWIEIALGMNRNGFDPDLFKVAREIASQNDPLDLMRWMTPYRDDPKFAIPVALVWEVNGNLEMAEQKLNEAGK